MSKLFPNIQITRSKSHKLARQDSFGNWVSDEAFCSVKGECLIADAEEAAAELTAFCVAQVEADFEAIRSNLEQHGATPIPTEQPRRAEAPDETPFKVSAAPPVNGTPKSAATIEEAPAPAVEVLQSGAPPRRTEEAPKRRGRAPKEKPPEGAAAMEALKADNPPIAAQPASNNGAFRASDDDLPDNIAAAPHTNVVTMPAPADQPAKVQNLAPTPQKSQGERFRDLTELLVAEHKKPFKDADDALRKFTKAFLHVDRLPKPPDPSYDAALPVLESYAKHYGGQMLTAPEVEGQKAGASWMQFVRKIDQWPDGHKHLAKLVATRNYPDEMMNLLEFLDAAEIAPATPEAHLFMQLLRIGREALAAVRTAAAKRGVTLAAVVGKLDLDLASEKDVLNTVAGGAA